MPGVRCSIPSVRVLGRLHLAQRDFIAKHAPAPPLWSIPGPWRIGRLGPHIHRKLPRRGLGAAQRSDSCEPSRSGAASAALIPIAQAEPVCQVAWRTI